ncbi:helix-turn-helix domain-containing protein [Pseudomonadota bacterium]
MDLRDLQREVASLKQQILVLEAENHNLKTASMRNQSVDLKHQNSEAENNGVMTLYADKPISEVLTALDTGESLDQLVANYEAAIIERALTHCEGNKAKAARLLKVRSNTLHYKLIRHQVQNSSGDNHDNP